MQKDEWKTDPLLSYYHGMVDEFLALGTPEETLTPLDADGIEKMRANYK